MTRAREEGAAPTGTAPVPPPPPRDSRAPAWHRHPFLGLVILLAVAALAAAVALALGAGRPRWPAAVAFALAACLPGAAVGWILARLPAPDPARAVAGSLASVALRILPPMAALGWLSTAGDHLREAGAAGLLVAFYLALWATDLLVHIMSGQAGARDSAPPH